VWKRTIDGRPLHFRLAGINNQNFLMRDQETGTWWQQVSGKAIFGPLKGRALEPALSDELTFGLWKQESPVGHVLAPVAAYEKKYESNWEAEVAKLPTVIGVPEDGLKARSVIFGIELSGESRAYTENTIKPGSPVQDRLHGTPLLIVMGPDNKAVRAFVSRLDAADVEFFQKTGDAQWSLVDSASGSEWNFQGCAVSGAAKGKCLEPVPMLKDYWFDWQNYHRETTVFHR
jgi:hypothetical protein